MNHQQFKKLTYQSRVKYLNDQLTQGIDIEILCNTLEIQTNDLINQLAAKGYVLYGNRFMLKEEIDQLTNHDVSQGRNFTNAIDYRKIQDNTNEIQKRNQVDKESTDLPSMSTLLERIEKLENIVLSGRYDMQVIIDLPDAKDVMMSSRVNEVVLKEWRVFTKSRPEKAKDLVSEALLRFMG